MTHKELLKAIRDERHWLMNMPRVAADESTLAILDLCESLVDLHKPRYAPYNQKYACCTVCGEWYADPKVWPCQTTKLVIETLKWLTDH